MLTSEMIKKAALEAGADACGITKQFEILKRDKPWVFTQDEA